MNNLKIKNNDCHAALAMTKNAQSGRSMIEMLGVLAIIGVLSVGGIAGYSKAMMKYRINKTIEQITLIAGNVRTFFAPQGNYEGLDNLFVLKKAKLFPDEMLNTECDTSCLEHHGHLFSDAFGSSVIVGRGNKNSDRDNKAFYISLHSSQVDACIELVSHDWSSINAGAIAFSGGPEGFRYYTVPLDLNTATEECTSEYAGEYVLYIDIDKNSTYWQNLLN